MVHVLRGWAWNAFVALGKQIQASYGQLCLMPCFVFGVKLQEVSAVVDVQRTC